MHDHMENSEGCILKNIFLYIIKLISKLLYLQSCEQKIKIYNKIKIYLVKKTKQNMS